MPNLTMHDPRLLKASVLRSTYIPECKVLHVAKLVLVRATRSYPEAHTISRSAPAEVFSEACSHSLMLERYSQSRQLVNPKLLIK